MRGEPPRRHDRAEERRGGGNEHAAVHAGDCARQAMDLMFRHGGSTSFKTASRLAEVWRDLQVVGQAATLAPEWYPIGGRAFLGLDPGPRLR